MKTKPVSRIIKTVIAIYLVAACIVAAFFVVKKLIVNVSGNYMYRSEKMIDLKAAGITDISALLQLDDPEVMDLRGNEISVEQYLALQEKFPACRIIWDVPLSAGSFSSLSESLSLGSYEESDRELLQYFESLKVIDLSDSGIPADEFLKLKEFLPYCEIVCNVRVNDAEYPKFSESISLKGNGLSVENLDDVLQELPLLKEVTVTDSIFSPEEQIGIISRYPDVAFMWDINLLGKKYSADAVELRLPNVSAGDMEELIACAPLLKEVNVIDLGSSLLELGDICSLRRAYGEAEVKCEFRFLEKQFSTSETELDLSNIKNIEVQDFDLVTEAMPGLAKVVMCDCGIPDETMDELNHKYDGVRFVWTVYVTRYYPLRTDRTYFCGSDRPNAGYVAVSLNDEEIQPLKYCTDIVAMDLGHMHFTSLDFVKDMKDLKYLVISCGMIHDISAVSELESLYYFEMFNNNVEDISPILACRNLRYLNIGSCTGFDRSPVFEMDFLDYLWYPYNYFSEEELEKLKAALPNTVCYLDNENANAVGNGWREMDGYNELRDLMHMFR